MRVGKHCGFMAKMPVLQRNKSKIPEGYQSMSKRIDETSNQHRCSAGKCIQVVLGGCVPQNFRSAL